MYNNQYTHTPSGSLVARLALLTFYRGDECSVTSQLQVEPPVLKEGRCVHGPEVNVRYTSVTLHVVRGEEGLLDGGHRLM